MSGQKASGRIAATSVVSSASTTASFEREKAAWLEMRRARRAAVVRFRRRALEAADLDSVLTDAMEIAPQVLDVELAKVLQHDASRDALVVRAATGWAADVTGRVIEHAQESSQAGYALRTGHPIVVEDLRRVDDFRGARLLRENHVISGATVIIHGQNKPWGVLSVHSTKRRMLSPDELDFLQALADVIAAAIYRFVMAQRRGGSSTRVVAPISSMTRR